ncbi:hypothetical protein BDZ88DRAFT_455943 [Geranomyces variabilis]|nr:hypothetical protein BDZ88DRAFT_455943 [Geranomyces variabilis]KAJ3140138.1 hypothetical protein HDU90_008362 [Geranomyces variabilis]
MALSTKELKTYIKAFALDDTNLIEKSELVALIVRPLSTASEKAFRDSVPCVPPSHDSTSPPGSPNAQKREREEREHQRRANEERVRADMNAQRAIAEAQRATAEAQRAAAVAEAQRATAEAQRAAAAAQRAAAQAQRHQQMAGGAGGSWFPAAAPGGFPNSAFGNAGSSSRPPPPAQPGFLDTLFGVAPGTIPAFGGFGGGPSDLNTTYTTSYSSNYQQSNAPPQQQQAHPQQQQYQQRQQGTASQQQQRPAAPQQNQNQQQWQQPRPAQPRPPGAQAPPSRPQPPATSSSSSAFAPPTLATLVASSTDPAALPTRTLKAILTENKVDHSNVIEKGELVARVARLVVAARAENAAQERANARFEERAAPNRPVSARRAAAAAAATENAGATDDDDDGLCKICCDKVVNCVFLECGHLVTCMDCGKILERTTRECPICREPIARIVRTFNT